jgi:hypothetical protein
VYDIIDDQGWLGVEWIKDAVGLWQDPRTGTQIEYYLYKYTYGRAAVWLQMQANVLCACTVYGVPQVLTSRLERVWAEGKNLEQHVEGSRDEQQSRAAMRDMKQIWSVDE